MRERGGEGKKEKRNGDTRNTESKSEETVLLVLPSVFFISSFFSCCSPLYDQLKNNCALFFSTGLHSQGTTWCFAVDGAPARQQGNGAQRGYYFPFLCSIDVASFPKQLLATMPPSSPDFFVSLDFLVLRKNLKKKEEREREVEFRFALCFRKGKKRGSDMAVRFFLTYFSLVQGLLLMMELTKSNATIQKIVAFENAFERLLAIIQEV